MVLLFNYKSVIIKTSKDFFARMGFREPMALDPEPIDASKDPKSVCRGYCAETDPYILPEIYSNFITPNQAHYILEMAKPDFAESKIMSGSDTSIRKSQTAWLPKTDPVVGSIIQRVCGITGVPFDRAEKMQVVKYQPNGYYNEHHDACCDDRPECIEFQRIGGQRVVTMVIYLTDQYEGGATRFINLKKDYKLPKYSGLLFYPLEKNGENGKKKGHPLALHAGMPVLSGEKYIANVWLREEEYNL
jgi:prolyl 4-hydroxylase